MKRLLALAVACGLIAGAVVFRQQRGEPGAETETAADTRRSPLATSLEVHCVEEIEAACAAAGIRTAGRFARTFDTLTSADGPGEVDVWITLEPWSGAVADQRVRAGLAELDLSGRPLASTTLALFSWSDLALGADAACPVVTLACLLSQPGLGDSIGVRDPARSASGSHALLALGAAATAQDVSVASAGSVEPAIAGLRPRPPQTNYRSPLEAMTLVGRAAFTATLDLATEEESTVRGTRVADELSVVPSDVALTVTATMVIIGEVDADEVAAVADSVAAALFAQGWDSPAPTGVPDPSTALEFRTLLN